VILQVLRCFLCSSFRLRNANSEAESATLSFRCVSCSGVRDGVFQTKNSTFVLTRRALYTNRRLSLWWHHVGPSRHLSLMSWCDSGPCDTAVQYDCLPPSATGPSFPQASGDVQEYVVNLVRPGTAIRVVLPLGDGIENGKVMAGCSPAPAPEFCSSTVLGGSRCWAVHYSTTNGTAAAEVRLECILLLLWEE
jgi:hypothetical protein